MIQKLIEQNLKPDGRIHLDSSKRQSLTAQTQFPTPDIRQAVYPEGGADPEGVARVFLLVGPAVEPLTLATQTPEHQPISLREKNGNTGLSGHATALNINVGSVRQAYERSLFCLESGID